MLQCDKHNQDVMSGNDLSGRKQSAPSTNCELFRLQPEGVDEFLEIEDKWKITRNQQRNHLRG